MTRAQKQVVIDALQQSLPILRCEEARHDILLKCTRREGATKEQAEQRRKFLRGKRREAHRARAKTEKALGLLGAEVPDA